MVDNCVHLVLFLSRHGLQVGSRQEASAFASNLQEPMLQSDLVDTHGL